MDFLSEMCSIKDKEYLTGTYYKRQPIDTTDKGEKFTYEVLDPHTREYRMAINNLLIEGRNAAIKTRSAIMFKEKEYIVTQDGQFWQVVSVQENVQPDQSKQALRFFIETAQAEKVIRLIGKDNPWDLQ